MSGERSGGRAPPWDQRLARPLARLLAATPVSAHQVTAASLALSLLGAALLARGEPGAANWGAALFCVARFVDHLDGELARLTGTASRLGYYLDYLAGALSYAALFIGIGLGVAAGEGAAWPLLLGAAGAAASLLSMVVDLVIDARGGAPEGRDAVGYPALGGFELEDGIYLLAPITWLGYLQPFFVVAGLGACLYAGWSALALRRRG